MKPQNIIGTITTYHGTEHPYLRGYDVRIVAVLHKGNTEPDADGEIPGYEHLDNDTDIARYGGVTANDRVEVAPFIEEEGRFSWVTSDPKAEDLACFAGLTRRHSSAATLEEPTMKRTAAADYSTEGLLGELLGLASDTNGILSRINSLEMEIHEAKASGEPVSTGANAIISLTDSVRGYYSDALDTILSRMDVLSGKTTPKPRTEAESPEE